MVASKVICTPTLAENIRLGLKSLIVKNALAYCGTEPTTALAASTIKLFSAVISIIVF
jgi:hypothetical protein